MAKIIIPTPLRKFTQNESSLTTEATDVSGAFVNLVANFPDLKNHLLDPEGKIRSFIRVFVGDEDILALNGEQTKISPDTVLSIVPAIAGGYI